MTKAKPAAKPPAKPASAEIKKGEHLYLIDGSGYIFRAYHALPPLTRKSDGLPVGAVAGFCNMLWKLLEDTKAGDRPTHLAVIFDAGRDTFRNEIYSEYKANRDEPPDDLIPQFSLVRDATRAFGVACVEQKGFEADDLIATYARQAAASGAIVTIVSSDKDLMQLVKDGSIEMLDTMKNKRIASAEVIERFGVPPEKVIDVQSLAGDSSDNIPGVPGIGVKTAAELIGIYGDLETLLERAGEIKQPKRRETLLANKDKALLSQKLVTLDTDVPVKQSLGEFRAHDPDPEKLIPYLREMEFATLGKRVAARLGIEDADAILPQGPMPASAPKAESKAAPAAQPAKDTGGAYGGGQVGAVQDRALYLKPLVAESYKIISDIASLDDVLARAREAGAVSIALAAESEDAMRARLIGIALAVGPNQACYIPLGHSAGGDLAFSAPAPQQLSEKEVFARLKPLFEDEGLLKIGHDIKFAMLAFLRRGLAMRCIDDAMLISYVLDCGKNGHGCEDLAELHIAHKLSTLEDITGKGRERLSFENVSIVDAARYVAAKADIALRLHALLKPRLAVEKRTAVYETLERPLVPVLAQMELNGIAIAPSFLAKLSNDFAVQMAAYEKDIYKLAGQEFNLGSPKQLGEILFDKLSLPGGKKTKTGAWSTDADILEELAAQGHDLPAKILSWRQLSKLKSTYTDALPQHINPETGRVHTSFALAATTTGRLSSIDPNLQNIPIRTEEGRKIRKAFVAEKGKVLISADYSQIELRLLAHVADVPNLREAFAKGIDIHAMTASEMFGVPVKDMPSDVRRRAKAINFGIIYGISAFGLANQLGIPQGEAKSYIGKYFERFPGIAAYMDSMREFVRANGYVETFFGRRIHLKDIKASSAAMRAFAERQAINAPLQGSAADIIRRAMVRLPAALAAKNLDAKLLLQVHDELVIEAPADQADAVCKTAKEVMEKAPSPALDLRVPLVVDARAGANWDEAH